MSEYFTKPKSLEADKKSWVRLSELSNKSRLNKK